MSVFFRVQIGSHHGLAFIVRSHELFANKVVVLVGLDVALHQLVVQIPGEINLLSDPPNRCKFY